MFIDDLMREKGITKYRLAKDSGVPYSTVVDIVSGKTSLDKCSGETLFKLAKTLEVTMEDLVEPYMEKRVSFEVFKSNVCHRLKRMGDIDFMMDLLESGTIWEYYNKKQYPECLYLLGMLDYLSRENNIPQCSDYDKLRETRLNKTIYPSGALALYNLTKDEKDKETALKNAIPEFLKFNIVEGDVRNVI